MHPLFEVCRKKNLPTRVVEVDIDAEFSFCQNRQDFESEYQSLGYANESLRKYFDELSYRNKEDNPVILEFLFEIYQKILKIERLIEKKQYCLITLQTQDKITAVGHNILWFENPHLQEGKEYYVRFILPGFSDRIISIFGEALSENALLIMTMHSRDIQEFDLFIATREMDEIRQSKRR